MDGDAIAGQLLAPAEGHGQGECGEVKPPQLGRPGRDGHPGEGGQACHRKAFGRHIVASEVRRLVCGDEPGEVRVRLPQARSQGDHSDPAGTPCRAARSGEMAAGVTKDRDFPKAGRRQSGTQAGCLDRLEVLPGQPAPPPRPREGVHDQVEHDGRDDSDRQDDDPRGRGRQDDFQGRERRVADEDGGASSGPLA
jgi:hypothetical protein